MRKLLTLILLTGYTLVRSQTYPGNGGPIDNTGQDTYFPLSVSGLSPAQIDSNFGLLQVTFDITHPAVQELYVFLQAPDGTMIQLIDGFSVSGANFTNTTLDSKAPTSVTVSAAPYSGTFSPVGFLGRMNNGQTGNGTWNLIIHDGIAFTNAGSLGSWSLLFGNTPTHPVVFTSSNLPILKIITNNQPITAVKTLMNMQIINNPGRNHPGDSPNDYNGKCNVHIRGSSTRLFEKQSYSLETADATGNSVNASVLGMPAESDWDLVASYQDKTLMRSPLEYDLFRSMGHYSPRHKMVEVMIDGKYWGVYALVEKPKRSTNRININKLSSTDNTMPNVSGGYILKIDRPGVPGWYSYLAGNNGAGKHFYYNYDYPKDTNLTTAQRTYIQAAMDTFETAINKSSLMNPVSGYGRLMDLSSFVDQFIMNEFSKDPDAYRLSTYLYKENITAGGRIHIGPLWDCDVALHNCNYGVSSDPTGWQFLVQDTVYTPPNWWIKMVADTNFTNAVYCRYHSLRQGLLSNTYLYKYIDSTAAVLQESQVRNFTQWPEIGQYVWPNPQNQNGASYGSEVADLKNWVQQRTAWLDNAITGRCTSVGINEKDGGEFSLNVFPNPFQNSTTFALNLAGESAIALRIEDPLGKEIVLMKNDHAPSGAYNMNFERATLPAGIYFYQMQVNNSLRTGKLIIR